MKKSIVTIVAFMLFALAGFAQGGERVYIRIFPAKAYVYDKGQVLEAKLNASPTAFGENLKTSAEILEEYFKKGYKLVATAPYSYPVYNTACVEYILQKD